MPFALRPQEMPLYPQPFVESEVYLLVITNQRLVQFGDEGRQEMEAREVGFVGRMSQRPTLWPGLLLLLVSLPLLVLGVYLVATARGPLVAPAAATAAAPANPADDPAGPADDPAAPLASAASALLSDANWRRLEGAGLGLLGLALLVAGGLLASRQRHLVLVRGGQRMIKLRVASAMEQSQVLSTLGALQQAARAAPPTAASTPAAAAKPVPVEVDDQGDPVKALQELAAARAAGKVPEDEFVAKREVLLARVRSRR